MVLPRAQFIAMVIVGLGFGYVVFDESSRRLLIESRRVTLLHDEPKEACEWSFLRYVPSPYESEWAANVGRYQDDVCGHFNAQPQRAAVWLTSIEQADAFPRDVFSYHVYGDSCTKQQEAYPIEPLAGLTRHPHMCLKGGDYVVDKSYMLIPPHLPIRTTGKAYYFDLGASYYDEGAGGASQSWLIDMYESRGVRFDGVYCWEAQKLNTERVWATIPAHIRPVYHWYNVPADPAQGHADNPLTILNATAQSADYVVFKLDIDNTPIEEAFIEQILASERLLGLIDAFYFEHHVNVGPMNPYWGTSNAPQRLKDTYSIFTRLRERGVAAHSWV